jgi:secreted Zn-dependent insulinase-like peptidase
MVLKDLYVRSLKNWQDEQPYNHALFNLKYVLSEKRWSHEELLKNIEGPENPIVFTNLSLHASYIYCAPI